ncbi:MAG: HlyD family type I secretion periplasmic adaptor subunit [Pseudomonadota bacterium]
MKGVGQNWSSRLPVGIGMTALVILLAGFGSWGILAKITGAVIASGQVQVEQNRQIVQHPSGGVVSKIHVREGDRVAKNQPLVTLDATALTGQAAVAEAKLFDALAQLARLNALRYGTALAEIDPALAEAANRPSVAALLRDQQDLLENTRAADHRANQQLQSRLDLIDAQTHALKKQQAALRKEGFRLADREHAVSPLGHARPVQNEDLQLKGKLAEIDAQIAALAARRAETILELDRLGSGRTQSVITQIRELQSQIVRLKADHAAFRRKLEQMQIKAPVSGYVFGLQFFAQGAVMRAAEPVLSIVPDDRPLVITAKIDPLHINEIYLNQSVGLRFPALDRQSSAELAGRITKISNDVFVEDRSLRRFYRIEIVMDDATAVQTKGLTLLPGMPVEAFIQTHARSPLAYLVEPLADYFFRAFRET